MLSSNLFDIARLLSVKVILPRGCSLNDQLAKLRLCRLTGVFACSNLCLDKLVSAKLKLILKLAQEAVARDQNLHSQMALPLLPSQDVAQCGSLWYFQSHKSARQVNMVTTNPT